MPATAPQLQHTKKRAKLSLDEAAEKAVKAYDKHLGSLSEEERKANLGHFLKSANLRDTNTK